MQTSITGSRVPARAPVQDLVQGLDPVRDRATAQAGQDLAQAEEVPAPADQDLAPVVVVVEEVVVVARVVVVAPAVRDLDMRLL